MHQSCWVILARVLITVVVAGSFILLLSEERQREGPARGSSSKQQPSRSTAPPPVAAPPAPAADTVTPAMASVRFAAEFNASVAVIIRSTLLEPVVSGFIDRAMTAAQPCLSQALKVSVYADAMRVHNPEAAAFAAGVAIAVASVANTAAEAVLSLIAVRKNINGSSAAQGVMVCERASKHAADAAQRTIEGSRRILSDMHVDQRYTYQRVTSAAQLPRARTSNRMNVEKTARVIAEAADAALVATQNVLRANVACELAGMEMQDHCNVYNTAVKAASIALRNAACADRLKDHNGPAALFTSRLAVAAADVSTAAADAVFAATTGTDPTAEQVAQRAGDAARLAIDVLEDACEAASSLFKERDSTLSAPQPSF